jgi:energy-coupling factor transporter ATP-binding protein EcfA2
MVTLSTEFIIRDKPPIILGNSDWNRVPMWGLIARHREDGREVALDVNTTSTILMLGSQGAGKSYALGSIMEKFVVPIKGGNQLPKPGCALAFHYSQSQDYKPELTLANQPNTNPKEQGMLDEWKILPVGIKEVIVITPKNLVDYRQKEYPHLKIVPLALHETEVSVGSYINLFGDAESTSFEMEVLLDLMEELRDNLSPERLINEIQNHKLLEERQKNLLLLKIRKASKYITKQSKIGELFKPGRLIIVDLRDEFLTKAMAFRIMLCILDVFQNAKADDGSIFPKILIADEAHEYANDPFLVENFVRLIRLMRHKSLTILIASQDPPSLDKRMKELASMTIMLNMETEAWVEDMAKAKMAIGKVPSSMFTGLESGQCMIWSRFATEGSFTKAPQPCVIGPRATMHGGFTKTAVAA